MRDQLEELVELRAQMDTSDLDLEDCFTEEVLRGKALMTVVWQRHPRWGVPEVVGVYHGAYCLYAAHGDSDLPMPPDWAIKAMEAAVRYQAMEIAA